jgi:hypothetical protein
MCENIRISAKGDEAMKRLLTIMAVLAALALPMVAGADDTPIPPEANWTPTPPARSRVDAVQLMDLLVKKGVLTPADQAHLSESAMMPKSERRNMDRHDGAEYLSQP